MKKLLLVVAALALTSCGKEEMKRERKGPRAEVEEPSITSKRDATGVPIEIPQLSISIDGVSLFSSSTIHSAESVSWAHQSTVYFNGDLGYRILTSTDLEKPILGLTPVVLDSTGAVAVDNSRAKLNPVYKDTSEILGGYDASVDAYSVSTSGFRGSVVSSQNNVITRVRNVIINVE